MRMAFTLQYQGTPYGGWQYQLPQANPARPSIQGALANALNQLLGEERVTPKSWVGAGRTDAGVHAWGQIAHIDIPDTFASRTPHSWITGVNRFLPYSIRVIAAQRVSPQFHARHSAIARHYTYIVWPQRIMRPDLLHRVGHAPGWNGQPLNISAMQAALNVLPLTPTDFSAFRDSECQSTTPICTLLYRHLTPNPDGTLWLTIGADHFLHHMVRNIVGTLVEIGQGKRSLGSMATTLASTCRTQAGVTFSPDGLYFTKVTYPADTH